MRSVIATVADAERKGSQGAAIGGVVGAGITPKVSGDAVSLLPTPDASAHKYRLGGGVSSPTASQHEHDAANLLPTPTTRDHKDHTIRREPHRPDAVDTLSRALTEVTEP